LDVSKIIPIENGKEFECNGNKIKAHTISTAGNLLCCFAMIFANELDDKKYGDPKSLLAYI
jgi:hypothetical protein